VARGEAHPVLMLETWIKEARSSYQRPAGMGDIKSPTVGREKLRYAQPNPPAAVTRPDTITNQKALSPPPV